MEIKIRGKKIYLYRSYPTPDDPKRNSRQKTVDKFPVDCTSIPDDVRKLLTRKEIDQLNKWLKDRREGEELREAATTMSRANRTLGKINRAIKNLLDTGSRNDLHTVRSNVHGLLYAMEVIHETLAEYGIKEAREDVVAKLQKELEAARIVHKDLQDENYDLLQQVNNQFDHSRLVHDYEELMVKYKTLGQEHGKLLGEVEAKQGRIEDMIHELKRRDEMLLNLRTEFAKIKGDV